MYLFSIVYAENMRAAIKKQRQGSLASTRSKPPEAGLSPDLQRRDRRTPASQITRSWDRMLAAIATLLTRQAQN